MRVIILGLLLVGFTAYASDYVTDGSPELEKKFEGRFERVRSSNFSGLPDVIIDHRTGCEFIFYEANSSPMTPLGVCDPDLINPKIE